MKQYHQLMNQGHEHAWYHAWDQAIIAFQQAVKLMPQAAEAQTHLGLAYFQAGQYGEALDAYKQAFALEREAATLEYLAETYLRLSDTVHAYESYMLAADHHLRQNDLAKAIQNWERAVQQKATWQLYTKLALAYERANDPRRAANSYLKLAILFEHSGEKAKARQALERINQVLPNQPMVADALQRPQNGQPLPDNLVIAAPPERSLADDIDPTAWLAGLAERQAALDERAVDVPIIEPEVDDEATLPLDLPAWVDPATPEDTLPFEVTDEMLAGDLPNWLMPGAAPEKKKADDDFLDAFGGAASSVDDEVEAKPLSEAMVNFGDVEAEEEILDWFAEDELAVEEVTGMFPAQSETEAEQAEAGDLPDWLADMSPDEPDTIAPPPAVAPAAPLPPPEPALDSPPQFSAFYPEVVQPNSAYMIMVFVHLDSAWEEIQKIASGYRDVMGSHEPKAATAQSPIPIEAGGMITFVPEFPQIVFFTPEQVVQWQPPYRSETFLFTTPINLTEDIRGRIKVYYDMLLIGVIPVHIAVQASAPRTSGFGKHGEFQAFEPIFASYSHRDTPVMEYFRSVRASAGQKMLVDIYDLRSGDHWSERLLAMIDDSAVFQLFWSENSAKSNFCQREWQYALQQVARKPNFIQPIRWERSEPMQPPPPPELAHIHFQPIRLPTSTRLKMLATQVKRYLK